MRRILCILILTLLPTGCDQAGSAWPARSMPAGLRQDAAALDAARAMFQRNCAYCHGKAEEGRSPRQAYHPPAPDFTESRYRSLDPGYLYWRIETGKMVEPYRSQGSVMPAWGPYFSELQIWQLVALIQSRAEHGPPAP